MRNSREDELSRIEQKRSNDFNISSANNFEINGSFLKKRKQADRESKYSR